MDNVMVKMWIDSDCVAMTTYCRRHGRRGRFLLILKEMQEWLLEDYGEWTLMDEDCGNVIFIDGRRLRERDQLTCFRRHRLCTGVVAVRIRSGRCARVLSAVFFACGDVTDAPVQ